MGKITAADQWMLAWAQEGYNYLWDRWGIMIGQTTQFCWVVVFGFSCMVSTSVGGMVFDVICAVFIIALAEARNYLQRKGLFASINMGAEQAQSALWLRWIGCTLVCTADIAFIGWVGIIDATAFLAYCFSWCLRVRDRDDSRFKKPKLAYQGASS